MNIKKQSFKKTEVLILICLILFGFALSVDAATITWDGGGADNLASNSANWSGGVKPQYGDNVIFDATSVKDCTWDLTVTLASLTKTSGYTGRITKIAGITLTIAKTMNKKWTGAGSDNLASNPLNWSGNAAPVNGDKVVFDNTSTKNCTWDINFLQPASFSLYSGYTGTVILDSDLPDLTINGPLTIESGAFNLNTRNLNVRGYIVIGVNGRLYATSSTITVTGDWANAGSFTADTSTVIFNGWNQTIYGNTTFYNLTKTVTSADTLYFEAGNTQTIINNLTLQGASGKLLSLRSTVDGQYWYLDPQGTINISFADIKDLNNKSFTSLVVTNSVDSGHNNNVNFGGNECACLTPPALPLDNGKNEEGQRGERGDFVEAIIGQASSLTEEFSGEVLSKVL